MRFLYFASFALAFITSFVGTVFVSRYARKHNIVDVPDMGRHLHKRPTPMLGGLAVFGSFFLITLTVGIFGGKLLNGNIPLDVLLAIWAGGFVLMIGGFLDDKYHLPAKYSIIFPVFASLIVVYSGVRAVSIHNPLNNEIVFLGPIFSGIVVFFWTLILTYTTKLNDGMDGLVTGISAIGALALFFLSLSPQVVQDQTALLAIIFAGSLVGFLILNFYPAKIFLGESGSTFAGFMLAVLAIVSGGKIATALLVMGIPLLDMVWVIIQRLVAGQSPFTGDRKHLHYKLIEVGFSESQAVLLLYAISGIFGLSALFLQSRGKLIALVILFLVMLAILASIYTSFKQRNTNEKD